MLLVLQRIDVPRQPQQQPRQRPRLRLTVRLQLLVGDHQHHAPPRHAHLVRHVVAGHLPFRFRAVRAALNAPRASDQAL